MNKETIADLNNRLEELLKLNHDHNITCHCYYDLETPQFLNVTYKSSEERSDYSKYKQNTLFIHLDQLGYLKPPEYINPLTEASVLSEVRARDRYDRWILEFAAWVYNIAKDR